mmetsp:Transcript_52623/g.94472  ORF Transcript_52623/g.94472 Transcript_52623/m.94472 type:complete len:212 (+) Transcript_52623:71-706(+)
MDSCKCCIAESSGEMQFGPVTDSAVSALPLSKDTSFGGKATPKEGKFETELDLSNVDEIGLEIDYTDTENFIVKRVSGTADGPLQVLDAIIAVNGERLTTKQIFMERVKGAANSKSKLQLSVNRPAETQVDLQKPGQLGITINYKKNSHGFWVSTIEAGLLEKWNDANPATKVAPHDRIVAVNGASGPPADMLNVLKEESTLKLTVMRYSA